MLGTSSRSGLSDLVITPEGTLFSLERSGVEGVPIFENRIYQLDFSGATNISQGAGQRPDREIVHAGYKDVAVFQHHDWRKLGRFVPGAATGQRNRVLLGVVDDGDAVSNNTLVAFELVAPLTLLGDINQDQHVNALDIAAMTTALTDLNAYKAAHPGLTEANLLSIADLNSDGKWNNADLQGLVTYIKSGNGSVAAVAEPSAVVLFALALPGLAIGAVSFTHRAC